MLKLLRNHPHPQQISISDYKFTYSEFLINGHTGFALWSILKNALGKELSRIPLPVDFNEPLSFIQRMSEVLEYSSLLDSAATIQSSSLQVLAKTSIHFHHIYL